MSKSTDPFAPPGRWPSGQTRAPRVGDSARPPAVVVLSVLLALAIIAFAAAAMLPKGGATGFDPTGAAGRAPVAAAKAALGLTSAPHAGASTASSTTAPAAPNSIDAQLPAIESFVEADRGLQFKTPVKVVGLSDAAFVKFLAGAPLTASQQADFNHEAEELQALGLVSTSVDFAKADQTLQASSIVGLYDPSTKALYVRGTTATPYVRQVMAHELTHALQDQWFGLYRPSLYAANDESGFAFRSLIEGDARRVEYDYLHAMSAADQQQAAAEAEQISHSGGLDPNIPQVLVTLSEFPYVIGPQFVRALLQAGGQARLDRAFLNPPTTSQQLLNPDDFLADRAAVPVAAPPADGYAFDHSMLGEVGLILLLNETIPPADSRVTADSWAGDSLVAWQSGARICVRDRLVTSGDSTLLSGALLLWARAHPGATVTGTGPFVLTSCT